MTHSYRNCPLWGRFRERIASACDSISFSCLHIEKLQYQRKHPIFLVLEAAWQKLNQFTAYLEIFLKGTRTWNIFSASAPMVAWGACCIKSLIGTLKCWIYAEVFDQKFRSCREWMLETMAENKWGIKQSVPLYPDNLPTPEVVDRSCPKIPEMRDRSGSTRTTPYSQWECQEAKYWPGHWGQGCKMPNFLQKLTCSTICKFQQSSSWIQFHHVNIKLTL